MNVRSVVDEPYPAVNHPQVVGMDVAARDPFAPALGEELHQSRAVAPGIRFAWLVRLDQDGVVSRFVQGEDRIEVARVR